MATYRSETAKKISGLVFNLYGWCKLSKLYQHNGSGTSPLTANRVGRTVKSSTTRTANLQQQNNDRKEFDNLCVTDTLGRTTLNLKTFGD